jgi:predicted dehydrogenase
MLNRRVFLAGAAAPLVLRKLESASNRINVGVIGVRGRGRDHIAAFSQAGGCRITAVCDVDAGIAARGQALAERAFRSKPVIYSDIRRLLENKDIDAVSIATPNHWHALATIWACQAGKDVYVEKPASHNIREGRRMVEAARKYGRIVQVGMQARSLEHYRRAIELVRQGAIGKVYMAKGLCFKRRKSIGRQPDGPVPAGVDYDLWLGPAPKRPFNPNRFHYNWHWFWDTGNGDIGNQGVHELDLARWGLGKQTLPKPVFSSGGKFVHDDDQETPNTQLSIFRYDDCQLVFEVRGLITGSEGNITLEGSNYIGVIFLGSEGSLTLDCNGFQLFLGEKRELAQQMKYAEPEPWSTRPHVENFLAAVRSRKREDLNCDVLEGHLSAALCHLANTSYRLNRQLRFDPEPERFSADDEANGYLFRQYRVPFVVPDKV